MCDLKPNCEIDLVGERFHEATFLAKDARYDLAIVSIPRQGMPMGPLALADYKLHEEVVAIARPYDEDVSARPELAGSTGIVEGDLLCDSERYFRASCLDLTTDTEGGWSGGPVLNTHGQVVAVTITDAGGVPASFLRTLLRQQGL